ncbi:hypothetical protein A1O1_08448 [Capronia coronata CBS 617.96]|uniref:Cyclin N-terminal domain-containing protein n=1 Tax=Capronia coronata CBS 617.96 TaxID=1182541 RepID=W9XTI5_9EURO|nr:uncharacterized protein A1O1_08448 [Capronia coronata CBS 617.96]EXJ80306.1 hypothetical protein A1O1_08448 [Capronia coronata CBS 617.96]
MGMREVVTLSSFDRPQNVQDSVSDWLQSGYRDFYNTDKISSTVSFHGPCKSNNSPDLGSVTTGDDNVSISDSAHESFSTESSSHTSWTNATDPVDVLSDEEEKDHVQQLKQCHGSRASVEIQEQLLKGLHSTDQSACSSLRSHANPDVSSVLEAQAFDRSLALTEAAAAARIVDTNARHNIPKCSLRRACCPSKKQISPPKLKRDTEVTDQFVSLLIIFATRLITAIWPLSACPPMMSTCFNGAGVLPLRVFIQETLRRSKTSYSTLQVALYYLILLKAKLPCADSRKRQQSSSAGDEASERSQCRAMQCGRRMFLSALMLASKYLQDRNYSARAWSKISGLRSSEINQNEREYLTKIDYNLHVPKELFDNWSKIVIALSKLSKEPVQCPSGSCNLDLGQPGSGTNAILADMVSEVDVGHVRSDSMFSDDWWAAVIQQLDPAMVKDPVLVNDFLQVHLPKDKIEQVLLPTSTKQQGRSWDALPPSPDHVYDMNFSDTLKPRSAEHCKGQTPQTPQTPVQTSPSRSSTLPMQPHLRNLPTPQTTPQLAEKCPWSLSSSRNSLRCSASVDALRSMKKQSIMNANLDRCPPPRPNGCELPPVKSLMRSAETTRESSSRSTTPTSSPASVASEVTAYTSRSRSSSVSSSSSWSSLASAVPRMRIASTGFSSSPLARVCPLSERHRIPVSGDDSSLDASSSHSNREGSSRSESAATPTPNQGGGYGSCGSLPYRLSKHSVPTISEVDAVRVLMSLSTHSETPSRSVTPTPQQLTGYGVGSRRKENEHPRCHKRSLSTIETNLQSQVRCTMLNGSMRSDALEDPLKPCYDNTPKQWQLPTQDWATPRKALPNSMDNKRLATYCSMQQFPSAPDLASQYLKDAMVIAS